MKIYIKTPLVTNAKGIPHMVEHCIGNSHLWASDFFSFTYWVDAEVSANYSVYEFDAWIWMQEAIDYLTMPLKKESFDFELPILQEECEDSSYDQRIYQEAIKILYDQDFDLNGVGEFSWKDVYDYHQNYYQKENMLIIDNFDWDKVLFQWENLKKIRNLTSTNLLVKSWVFEDDAYVILGRLSSSVSDFWRLFFVHTLIEGYIFQQKRWKEGEYYHGMPYFFTYNEAIWLLIPHYDFSHYTQDFFQQGKTYLLNMFKAGYFTQRFLLNEYFYGLPATKNQVIDWCQSFSWEEFQQEILNPLINIKK